MKITVKTISLILVLIFALSAFASCGGDGKSKQQVTTDAGSEQEEPVESGLSLKILSFNLRYDTTSHPLMGTDYRGAHLMEVIDKYTPDSIGFCEATDDWMNYLRPEMKSRGYDYVGLGRDAGKDSDTLKGTGNEHTPVFYNSEKYTLIDSGNFWLSTTPDQPGSIDWNSACKRVCSWVLLEDKESGKRYAHFATHLDHVSIEAQYNGIRVIENKINKIYEKYGNIGVILSGDLNCSAYEQAQKNYIPYTYNFVTTYLDDSRVIAKKKGVDGSTWSGYQNPVDWENGRKSDNDKPAIDTTTAPIDYILTSKGRFDVSYYTVVDDTFTFEYKDKTWHNHPISDHYGLYVECTVKGGDSPAGYDESHLIGREAAMSISESMPAIPAGSIDLAKNATLKSGVKGDVTALKSDGAMLKSDLNSKVKTTDLYMELTAKFDSATEIDSITVKTGGGSAPLWAECFVSEKGASWDKVGATITEQLKNNTAYTWTLGKQAKVKYVKVVFISVEKNTEIDRFAVYGPGVEVTDPTDGKLTLIPVSGPKAGENEGYEKIADGDEETKFYINTGKNDLSPLVFKIEGYANPVKYTMTSANDTPDYPDRVPAGWILYGSSDGENWSVIDEVDDPGMEADKFVTYEYPLSVNGIYSYFKLEFKLGSTGKTQISEFEIFKSE